MCPRDWISPVREMTSAGVGRIGREIGGGKGWEWCCGRSSSQKISTSGEDSRLAILCMQVNPAIG